MSNPQRKAILHPMYPEKVFEIQSDLCRAMGSPVRMEILNLLRNGPITVNQIASATNHPQATISRNLTILRNVDIVATQREGTNVLYHIANPKLMEVCDLMREVLIEQTNELSALIAGDKE
ncbi:MAG TPA: metalloregulator ArsR/SmtB family transcription factor [Anaerolineales bacterium]|nr:metalloregulator ArsR/SmtB family transcription factor [Anaerolineales bacterium]